MHVYICEHLARARAYVVCLPVHLLGARARVAGTGSQLSHGDFPTAIMAGVTHNNADVIAPSQPISSCAMHVSQHRPALDSSMLPTLASIRRGNSLLRNYDRALSLRTERE